MANNNSLGKIIGYGIAGVLGIGGVSVVITKDDIAEQYKKNTGMELSVNEEDLVTFGVLIKDTKEEKAVMQEFYDELDCSLDYGFYENCNDVKQSLKNYIGTFDGRITCFEKVDKDEDLEKSDIMNCVSSLEKSRDTEKDFILKTLGSCDEDCQADINSYEYNIAMFQAYLNKLD